MRAVSNCTRPKYVCGNNNIKLVGATDGYFPDFGHHLEKEMGGLWLYPVKLLDGFWMKFKDEAAETVDSYIIADTFENYPHKNVFHYGNGMGHTPVTIKRTQIAPDGIKGIRVTYEFFLPPRSEKPRKLEAELLTRVNLRPDWLAEEMQIFDGTQDEIVFDAQSQTFTGKDNRNPWSVMIGSSEPFFKYETGNFYGPEVTTGNGTGCKMHFSFTLNPGEGKKIEFYFAGSIKSTEECKENYKRLVEEKDCEQKKEAGYAKLLESAKLCINDPDFTDIFDWVKVHTDWLTLETEGVGKGVAAGLPEYAWWFGCDSCYALQGMMMQGNFELCRDTIAMLLKYSEHYNGNGRIIHEILPNGFSPNFGNTQETAHFIYLLWEYYQWTKDKDTLKIAYPYISKSVKWLQEQDEDYDYFPTGYGIIEIAGLNMEMIDTAAYTAVSYGCYAKISRVLGYGEECEEWEKLSEDARNAVHDLLWSKEEGLFCDCYASAEKIEEKKQMILDQMKEAGAEEDIVKFEKNLTSAKNKSLEKGWLLNKNWVINVPFEVGIADEKQAERALKRMHTPEFIGEYGMYLEGLRKNAMMTISTGVMAVAQAKYGYVDRALELVKLIMKSFSMATPGSISEMSPDYGCFVQAWTAYGVVVPVVKYFFGICPDAVKNTITVAPKLPKQWTGESSIEQVRVLDGTISVRIKEENGKKICIIKNTTSAKIEVTGNFDNVEIS